MLRVYERAREKSIDPISERRETRPMLWSERAIATPRGRRADGSENTGPGLSILAFD